MVGFSQEGLSRSQIPARDLDKLCVLDILNALSLDPETSRPYPGCSHQPKPDVPTRKLVLRHIAHVLPRCDRAYRSWKEGTPDSSTITTLRQLLFPEGGPRSFQETVWSDICSRGKDGYKRTWVCCDAISKDTQHTQVLASRGKTPTREQCPHCDFTCSTGELNDHIRDQHKCPFCLPQNCYEGPSLREHLASVHHFVDCVDCAGTLSFAHLSISHQGRGCPCGRTICQESAIAHLAEHPFVYCGQNCKQELVSDWDSHLKGRHPSSRCTVQGCEALFIGTGFLRTHLIFDHYFRPCKDCCCMDCLGGHCAAHPNGRETAWQHVFKHGWAKCLDPSCGLFVQDSLLDAHLCFHKWVACGVCGSMKPTTEALDTHLLNHPLCQICNTRHTHAQFDQHLSTHNSTSCRICKEIVEIELLPMHFAIHHETRLGGDSTLPPGQPRNDPELDALLQRVEDASLAQQLKLYFEARCTQPSRKRPASGPASASKKIAKPDSIDDLVEKLVDKGASNFVQLVRAIRDPQQANQLDKFRNLPSDANARAVVLSGIAKASHADVHVAKLLQYRALVLLADALDSTKHGRRSVDPVAFTDVLKRQGLASNHENLAWVKRQYQGGKDFKRSVAKHDGLLCFLAMVENCRPYIRLKDDRLKAFHDSIGVYRHLWDAGRNLLGILEGEEKKFAFESQDTKDMSQEVLQPLLRLSEDEP